ncbi:hypothetical protein [Methylocaldum marinum]|nr:hypothetical protein [Methylocaldum marinum]
MTQKTSYFPARQGRGNREFQMMLIVRRISYFAYIVLRRIARWKYRESNVKRSRLLVWPPASNLEELNDIVDWIAWYIPAQSGLSVTLVGTPALAAERGYSMPAEVTFLTRIADESFETVLIHKHTVRCSLEALERFNAKLECIDKRFFTYHESVAFQRIYALHDTVSLSDTRKKLEEVSRKNYEFLYSRYKGCQRAFVLGTGPSIQQIFHIDVSQDDLVIACNSLVKNQKVFSYARPAVLTFADPVFHFGRSAYAQQFREHLASLSSDTNVFFIVPPEHGLLLALHYPSLISRLIVLPVSPEFNLPTPENRKVQVADNIMTLYMLPVASAMAQEVYVIGADGRAQADNYFWKHDQDSQYGNLMKTAVDAHPSFFRDRDYKAYFKHHCDTMEALISQGERRGVRYYSVSSSTIPALRQRAWERHGPREQLANGA